MGLQLATQTPGGDLVNKDAGTWHINVNCVAGVKT